MNDFAIANIQIHLAASKNRSYRESIYRIYGCLLNFLQDHDLTTRRILENGCKPPDNLKIMRSDLTDLGYEVIKRGLDKWVKNVTSGKIEATDTELLEKLLKKLRQEN